MASIRQDIVIDAPAAQLWDALRDVGALHTRLAPGFVVDTKLEPGARVVTFANGVVARELIVTLDDAQRRLVWSIVGGRCSHYNASAQVFDAGERRCRLVWIADVLPDDAAAQVGAMMEQGIRAVRETAERAVR